MKIKTLVINALVAAMYIVVTAIVAPFGFANIQFRLSELFNHLIVLNKKYFFGIIIGVLLANFFFAPMKQDMIFGVLHTALSLSITLVFAKFITNKIILMMINTFVFSFNMFIIAYMLKIYANLPDAFMFLWVTTGLSEFITMGLSIPLMYYLNKRLHFSELIKTAK